MHAIAAAAAIGLRGRSIMRSMRFSLSVTALLIRAAIVLSRRGHRRLDTRARTGNRRHAEERQRQQYGKNGDETQNTHELRILLDFNRGQCSA